MKSSSEKCGSRFAARRVALHLHCLTASFALRTRALEASRGSRRLPRERAYRRRAWARFYWPDEVRPAQETSFSITSHHRDRNVVACRDEKGRIEHIFWL